jgi:hypothetical protein
MANIYSESVCSEDVSDSKKIREGYESDYYYAHVFGEANIRILGGRKPE